MDKSSSGRGPEPEHPLPSPSRLQPMQNPCRKMLAQPRHSTALSLCSWQQCQLTVSVSVSGQSTWQTAVSTWDWENGDNIRKKHKHLTYLLLPSHPALGEPPCHGLSQHPVLWSLSFPWSCCLLQAWALGTGIPRAVSICCSRQHWEQCPGCSHPVWAGLAPVCVSAAPQRVRMEQ